MCRQRRRQCAGGVSGSILYSANGGASWSTTEPATASSVTDSQWWLKDALPAGAHGSVGFQVTVPATYARPTVPNTAGLSFGSAAPFAEDSTTTLLRGNNTLSGTVFYDNGAGGGAYGNGVRDGSEAALANVLVSLYLDLNSDGAGDILVGSAPTAGAYSFTNLPDGTYVVQADPADPDIPAGYTHTNDTTRVVSLDPLGASASGVTQSGIDFGFAPALTLDKRLVGSSPIYEGQTVQYTIDMRNRLPGNGTATASACSYTGWAQVEASQTSGLPTNQHFTASASALGATGPDGSYSHSPYTNSKDSLAGTNFSIGLQNGSITKVEAVFSLYLSGNLSDDINTSLFFNNDTATLASTTIASNNAFAGAAKRFADVGRHQFALVGWADFAGNLDLQFDATKQGATDPTLYLDAIGFRVTNNQTRSASLRRSGPVPLTDNNPAACSCVGVAGGR